MFPRLASAKQLALTGTLNHAGESMTAFASLVLDVDSTLCGVEGIDWLAERRGRAVAEQSRKLTERAMGGAIDLETVYGERLSVVRPTPKDIAALSDVYRKTIAEGASDAIGRIKAAGVRIVLVSGGIRQAIAPLADALGVELQAVELEWDAKGEYKSFRPSPLSTQSGKISVVRSLGLARPSLAVGDGATDVVMRDAVDLFAACTIFVRRAPVVAAAAREVASFADLERLVVGSKSD